MKKSLLIIDADENAHGLVKVFTAAGHTAAVVGDVEQGLHLLKEASAYDGALLDVNLFNGNLIKSISEIKTIRQNLLVVLLGRLETPALVECIKHGADGIIDQPLEQPAQVVRFVEQQFKKSPEASAAAKSQKALEQMIADSYPLVGQGRVIMDLKRMIQKIAPLDSTILITGETGTGKEVVARMIHSLSPHRNNNFIAVHCGGIPDTLLESTLFGHEKGSFTGAFRTHKGHFEVADKGTIFLDEIGDTTSSFQVKLLRVLQDKQFRRIGGTEVLTTGARIIAATNRDLTQMIKEGTFREDLYFRLNVITLRVSPLRERSEDIPLLIRHFVHLFSKKHNHLGVYLKPDTIDILQRQYWRGNVRELENVIERLVALSDSDWIGPEELPADYLKAPETHILETLPLYPYAEAKDLFEKEYITKLLIQSNGNISKAARLAGMPRQNLHLKIRKHKIKSETLRAHQPTKEETPISPSKN
ncbi:sigma-54-dependent Fis family transcriptional regulator [bacterium]|nr:sigma-54-dependent Fis family transcriptional regulator [bacterium]